MSFLSMFILLSMLEQQLPNTIHREKNRESLKLSEAHLCHRTQPSSWSVESPCPTSVSEGERETVVNTAQIQQTLLMGDKLQCVWADWLSHRLCPLIWSLSGRVMGFPGFCLGNGWRLQRKCVCFFNRESGTKSVVAVRSGAVGNVWLWGTLRDSRLNAARCECS